MIARISELTKTEPPHNIAELRILFRENVDNRISDFVLYKMRAKEMRRIIAISIYERAVTIKNRQLALEKIAGFVNVSVSSIEKWCPAKQKSAGGDDPDALT